jgi:hypothetical protein
MMILNYFSKKELAEKVGKPLNYTETSFFGNEYPESGNGKIVGCNRPTITGITRIDPKTGKRVKAKEFFAAVTLKDGLIAKVE